MGRTDPIPRALACDGVIFDLDGTLADALEDVSDAMNHALREEHVPEHDYAEYRLLIGRGIRNLVVDTLPRERRDDETIARCYERMVAYYGEHVLDKTRLYDGVAEMLAGLRAARVRLAVLSNKADDLTRRVVDGLVGAGVFDVVAGARPGIPLKPDPAGALLVGERLGIAPGRTAYVGDSGIDMLTGRRAGMIAVGVTWGLRERAELLENGADAVIDHPRELLELRA